MVLDPGTLNSRVGHLQGPKASEHPKRAVAIFFFNLKGSLGLEIQPRKHAQSPRRKNTELLESLPLTHYRPLQSFGQGEPEV